MELHGISWRCRSLSEIIKLVQWLCICCVLFPLAQNINNKQFRVFVDVLEIDRATSAVQCKSKPRGELPFERLGSSLACYLLTLWRRRFCPHLNRDLIKRHQMTAEIKESSFPCPSQTRSNSICCSFSLVHFGQNPGASKDFHILNIFEWARN